MPRVRPLPLSRQHQAISNKPDRFKTFRLIVGEEPVPSGDTSTRGRFFTLKGADDHRSAEIVTTDNSVGAGRLRSDLQPGTPVASGRAKSRLVFRPHLVSLMFGV